MKATALVPVVAPSTELPLPLLIAGAWKRAAWRFLEFFAVNIRNRNTRAAYARAAGEFLRWCEGQGIGELGRVQPVYVAAYIEQLQSKHTAPTDKQHLAWRKGVEGRNRTSRSEEHTSELQSLRHL